MWPGSRKFHARISGHLGKNVAPWPWASLTTTLSGDGAPVDIGFFTGVQFYAKGDGRAYRFTLYKKAVSDFAQYGAKFKAGKDWTLIKLPFSSFAQPFWTKSPVPAVWDDVASMSIDATEPDAPFDIAVSELSFYRDIASARP